MYKYRPITCTFISNYIHNFYVHMSVSISTIIILAKGPGATKKKKRSRNFTVKGFVNLTDYRKRGIVVVLMCRCALF